MKVFMRINFKTGFYFFITYLFVNMPCLQATTYLEVKTILLQYLKNPKQVGQIAPISSVVSEELSRFVGRGNSGKQYLEAGGGCGAVSVVIAMHLREGDHLDIIEIDPKMCEILKERLKFFPNISVHCCSILDWNPEYQYDAIISTLPFNSLGCDFTQNAIAYFQKVSKPFCMFSYVEYPIVRQALQYFYGNERRESFLSVQKYLETVRAQYLISKLTLYLNLPPVTVYHLCFQS